MLKARELLGQKKIDEAIAIYDRILVEDPAYPKRGDMVAGYLERGRAFRDQKKLDEAILSFHKAWSLDPKGAQAKEAEAELYATRAAREQAQGRNADEDLRRAQAADPAVVPAASRSWMLFAGIAAGAAGLLLAALGLLRRRRA